MLVNQNGRIKPDKLVIGLITTIQINNLIKWFFFRTF
jgi:hypothetical protein